MNPSTAFRFVFILMALFVTACSSNKNKESNITSPDLFHEYISGFTSGEIKRSETIVIKFTTDMFIEADRGKIVPASVLRFNPSVKGKAI